MSISLLPLLQACPDANVYVRGVVEMYASAVSSAVVNVVGLQKASMTRGDGGKQIIWALGPNPTSIGRMWVERPLEADIRPSSWAFLVVASTSFLSF